MISNLDKTLLNSRYYDLSPRVGIKKQSCIGQHKRTLNVMSYKLFLR